MIILTILLKNKHAKYLFFEWLNYLVYPCLLYIFFILYLVIKIYYL